MRLAVLSTGRQDWGILRSVAGALRDDRTFDLQLIAGGMHCAAQFGSTVRHIEAAGFDVAERLAWVPDQGAAPAHEQAGRALALVGEALERLRPEALVLAGDRFETAAAAVAATIARVPIVHLHGGEQTEGAFDDALRHSITKLSHLHLVSHPDHAARVIALGEDPAAVHVVGAPGLDNALREDLPNRSALEERLDMRLEHPVVVVTLHPATLGADARQEAEAVAVALDKVDATYVVTLPNADPGHEVVRATLKAAAAARPKTRRAVEALGENGYWGLLRVADAMLGNSSSALIEAPVVALPAVNVGDRQKGRLRGNNVIDAPGEASAIEAALRMALSPETRKKLRASGARSPYGDGCSGRRIAELLRQWRPPCPPVKPPVRVSRLRDPR
jgi:GDP/UDP-N,N'-diacetylbacillosamine 2-epimerase (hydrolysing)